MWNSVTASLQPSPALVPDLFERHGVRLGIAHALAESAEAAACDAHIRGVDVAIDVEISAIAVQPFAHDVRQIANAEDVVGAVKRTPSSKRETFAGLHLVADRNQARVIEYGLAWLNARLEEENIGGPEDQE